MKARRANRVLRLADERLGYASVARKTMAKIFPDHWSFMLGEIALYSFMFLVATGIYLVLFFDPSSHLTTYDGSYAPMHGKEVSSAYASTVSISFDVRAGLLVRQAHHWAAHIFIGAIVLHLCRIFFTGMFRKPRELNWTVGVTLLILAIFNGFAGYSLPDDLLSGTGLHIFFSIAEGTPFIGDWLAFLVFGGNFPGDVIIERLYALHILIVPALIAILITVHMAVLIRQKHSHFSGPGRSDANVVGSRMWPSYAIRSLSLLFFVSAVCVLLGGFAQINPIWVWGDFSSPQITAPSVADWYVGWIEGGLRLFPPMEPHLLGFTIPNQFWAGVLLPLVTFGALYLWPWIDRRLTHDHGTHHLTGRPRESPGRVAIGVAALTFYGVCLVAMSEETLVQWTNAPVADVRNTLRVVVIVLPLVTGFVAHRIARALRDSGAGGLLLLSKADWRRARQVRRAGKAPPVPPSEPPSEEESPEAPAPGEPLDEEGHPLTESPAWVHPGGRVPE
jgi:ubiquinol-cytochrome c reductase cytochrome b subunit